MNTFTIVYSKSAVDDLTKLVSYIANEIKMPLTAERFFRNLIARINTLSYVALSYAPSTQKDVLRYGVNARRINYKKWAIIYNVSEKFVCIERIIFGALITE